MRFGNVEIYCETVLNDIKKNFLIVDFSKKYQI